jgi:hypothetical protein
MNKWFSQNTSVLFVENGCIISMVIFFLMTYIICRFLTSPPLAAMRIMVFIIVVRIALKYEQTTSISNMKENSRFSSFITAFDYRKCFNISTNVFVIAVTFIIFCMLMPVQKYNKTVRFWGFMKAAAK